MDTCQTHGVEKLEVDGGTTICPICEADETEALVARGEEPATVTPGYIAIPAEGTKLVSIRFDKRDLERARVLAKARKMPYQRYVKTLLSEALDRDEREIFSRRVGGE
jgi:uncharacterized Zn finger protein (UPF0148 family)